MSSLFLEPTAAAQNGVPATVSRQEHMELRCDSKKFGEVLEPGVIEVKCQSRFCGAGDGVIVLHKFDTMTGHLIETVRFRAVPHQEG